LFKASDQGTYNLLLSWEAKLDVFYGSFSDKYGRLILLHFSATVYGDVTYALLAEQKGESKNSNKLMFTSVQIIQNDLTNPKKEAEKLN
jgi:hypothetical protein